MYESYNKYKYILQFVWNSRIFFQRDSSHLQEMAFYVTFSLWLSALVLWHSVAPEPCVSGTMITASVVCVIVTTMRCSGQPAEVHKETRQARTHSKPSPAGRRWRRARPPLDALNG